MPKDLGDNMPGPLGLADADRARGILERAGFTGVELKAVRRPMRVGDDVDDAVRFIFSIPTVRDLLGTASSDERAAVVEAARRALMPYASDEGVVTYKNDAWLVTATAG